MTPSDCSQIALGNSTYSTNSPQPMFIFGMSRAGTTWLAKCLSQRPDTCLFGETGFWGRRFIAPSKGNKLGVDEIDRLLQSLRNVGVMGQCNWHKPCLRLKLLDLIQEDRISLFRTPMDPAELYRLVLQRVATRMNTDYVIEKTPHHINWVNRILTYLPDARFIVHIREPYGFMRSYKHQGDRKPGDVKKVFEMRYHPLACSIVWRGYMRSAARLQAEHPKQTILVRFEDLQADGEGVLRNVQEFLGLRPMDLSCPPHNSSFPTGPKPKLSPGDLFAMNLCASREIAQAGFPRVAARAGLADKVAVFASLPSWGIANLASMKRAVNGSLVQYLWRWIK